MDKRAESVEIRSASKTYGAVRALDDVSLDVGAGEFVSLLGPSGSGKTTLLGILGGFILPSSGSIHFGGRDVTYMPPHKRDIGVVFQNYALFPHMSVGENVAFPLRARRLPKATWPDKVRGALGMPKSMKDDGGCQIFIMHTTYHPLDERYTCYGHVVNGMSSVDKIRVGDFIRSARVVVR